MNDNTLSPARVASLTKDVAQRTVEYNASCEADKHVCVQKVARHEDDKDETKATKKKVNDGEKNAKPQENASKEKKVDDIEERNDKEGTKVMEEKKQEVVTVEEKKKEEDVSLPKEVTIGQNNTDSVITDTMQLLEGDPKPTINLQFFKVDDKIEEMQKIVDNFISIVKSGQLSEEEILKLFLDVKSDIKSIQGSFDTSLDRTAALMEGTTQLLEDTAVIKEDTATLKEDAATLKEDTAVIKEDTADIKGDTVDIKAMLQVLTDEIKELRESRESDRLKWEKEWELKQQEKKKKKSKLPSLPSLF